ncbi:hypothetical protein CBL_11632 [Carabus blaptoides fortunei]
MVVSLCRAIDSNPLRELTGLVLGVEYGVEPTATTASPEGTLTDTRHAGQFGNNAYGSGMYGNQKYGSGAYSIEVGSKGYEYGNQKYNSGVYSSNVAGTNGFKYGNQKYGSGVYSSNAVPEFGNNGYGLSAYENQHYRTGAYASNEVSQFGKNLYGSGVTKNQEYGSEIQSSNGASQFGNNEYGYGNTKYEPVNHGTGSFNNADDYNSGNYQTQYDSGLYNSINSQTDNLKSNVYGPAYGNKYEISTYSNSAETYNGQVNNYSYGSNAYSGYDQDKYRSTDFVDTGNYEYGPSENRNNGNNNQATSYVNVKGKGYGYNYRLRHGMHNLVVIEEQCRPCYGSELSQTHLDVTTKTQKVIRCEMWVERRFPLGHIMLVW